MGSFDSMRSSPRELFTPLRIQWLRVEVKEHEYFVYIVCSRSGTLYIGISNTIYRRALEHKRGEVEGFAGKYRCNRLVWYESYDDVRKAIDREKQLKR